MAIKNKKIYAPIPPIVNTDCFLYFVTYFLRRFRAAKGYGRWLKEYQRMDEQGLFTPEQLRELYKPILEGSSKLTYIYKDAVNSICSQALTMTESFLTTRIYEIRTITGAIALDDNDYELVGLPLNRALIICKAMNIEAEEELFIIYNGKTHRPIAKAMYNHITFKE